MVWSICQPKVEKDTKFTLDYTISFEFNLFNFFFFFFKCHFVFRSNPIKIIYRWKRWNLEYPGLQTNLTDHKYRLAQKNTLII
jgi:hypothetical protein